MSDDNDATDEILDEVQQLVLDDVGTILLHCELNSCLARVRVNPKSYDH